MSKNFILLLSLLISVQLFSACSSGSDSVDGDSDYSETEMEADDDIVDGDDVIDGDTFIDGDGYITDGDLESEQEESEPPLVQTKPDRKGDMEFVFDENNISLRDWRVRDFSEAVMGLGASNWTVINRGLIQWASMGDTQESEPDSETSPFLSSELRYEYRPFYPLAIEIEFTSGLFVGGLGFSFNDGENQAFVCLNESVCGSKFARFKSADSSFVSGTEMEFEVITDYTLLLTMENGWLLLSLNDNLLLTAPVEGNIMGTIGILNYLMQGLVVKSMKIWGEQDSDRLVPDVDWKVIAHRGHGNSRESNALPENTIKACKQGYGDGADYLEIDVLLSSDDIPVLMHDDTLDRTTNCTGKVMDKTLEELKLCKIEDDSSYVGEDIFVESLDEAFTQVPDANWFVELKSTGNATSNQTLANTVVTLLQQHNLDDDSYVISFSLSMLELVEQIDSSIHTAYVVSSLGENHIQDALDAGVDAMDIGYLFVTKDTVNEVHDAGLDIFIWTADNQSEFESYIEMGVNGITTNNPDRLRATAYKK